jgi:SulP family sulfate permease
MSRDFAAQGAANVASGLVRGLPVGGSLSTTALSVLAGARTRWAAVFAGLWMVVVVVALPGLVAAVAMPALGALLIVASASTIKPAEALALWKSGWSARLTGATTFLGTLFLPIQAAVGLGVLLAALLYLNRSSTDVSVVELVLQPDGKVRERPAPEQLPSNQVTVLDVYGHLFYAGARTLERLLPAVGDARNPVVVLRLRGRATVGTTLVEVLAAYVDDLGAANGRLYLTGVNRGARDRIRRTGRLELGGPLRVYEATAVRGESTSAAYEHATSWLVGRRAEARG